MPSKGTSIQCVGGSKDGRVYQYPDPLPNTLVFDDHSRGTREEYFRKPNSCTYLSADKIPPGWRKGKADAS